MGRLPARPSHDIVPREEDCSEAPVQAPFCLCPSACLRVGEQAPEVLSRGSETAVGVTCRWGWVLRATEGQVSKSTHRVESLILSQGLSEGSAAGVQSQPCRGPHCHTGSLGGKM